MDFQSLTSSRIAFLQSGAHSFLKGRVLMRVSVRIDRILLKLSVWGKINLSLQNRISFHYMCLSSLTTGCHKEFLLDKSCVPYMPIINLWAVSQAGIMALKTVCQEVVWGSCKIIQQPPQQSDSQSAKSLWDITKWLILELFRLGSVPEVVRWDGWCLSQSDRWEQIRRGRYEVETTVRHLKWRGHWKNLQDNTWMPSAGRAVNVTWIKFLTL